MTNRNTVLLCLNVAIVSSFFTYRAEKRIVDSYYANYYKIKETYETCGPGVFCRSYRMGEVEIGDGIGVWEGYDYRGKREVYLGQEPMKWTLGPGLHMSIPQQDQWLCSKGAVLYDKTDLSSDQFDAELKKMGTYANFYARFK
jgi:hypothetical protein